MLNRVVLVGRLTRDPELRKTPNGKSVTSVTVAVDNMSRGEDGSRTASFIPVTIWNQTADYICSYTHKGTLVGIDGRLQQRTYKRNDGTTAQVVEVIADRAVILTPREASNESANSHSYSNNQGYEPDRLLNAGPDFDESAEDLADDDLPFEW